MVSAKRELVGERLFGYIIAYSISLLNWGIIQMAKAKKSKTTKRTGTKKSTKKSGRKPNAAFMAPMQPSEALAVIVGPKAIPRTQVVKKVWEYIKRRKLQDPKNKRNIVADDTLSKIFRGKKVVTMFEMTKLINGQLSAAR